MPWPLPSKSAVEVKVQQSCLDVKQVHVYPSYVTRLGHAHSSTHRMRLSPGTLRDPYVFRRSSAPVYYCERKRKVKRGRPGNKAKCCMCYPSQRGVACETNVLTYLDPILWRSARVMRTLQFMTSPHGVG